MTTTEVADASGEASTRWVTLVAGDEAVSLCIPDNFGVVPPDPGDLHDFCAHMLGLLELGPSVRGDWISSSDSIERVASVMKSMLSSLQFEGGDGLALVNVDRVDNESLVVGVLIVRLVAGGTIPWAEADSERHFDTFEVPGGLGRRSAVTASDFGQARAEYWISFGEDLALWSRGGAVGSRSDAVVSVWEWIMRTVVRHLSRLDLTGSSRTE